MGFNDDLDLKVENMRGIGNGFVQSGQMTSELQMLYCTSQQEAEGKILAAERAWPRQTYSFTLCFSPGGGLITKMCPTLVIPWTVHSLPGSSVHGILQARILDWVAISFSMVFTQGISLLFLMVSKEFYSFQCS